MIQLKPYSKKSDIWDGEHVRMPFSDKSKFPKESASSAGEKKVVDRYVKCYEKALIKLLMVGFLILIGGTSCWKL